MKIVNVKVDAFGKLKDLDLKFDPHFTIIYGRNESGKTTLHRFIRSMFFGVEKKRGRASKEDDYNRYLPWENENRFGGKLYLEDEDGKKISIIKNFFNNDSKTNLKGITSNLYDNTINVGQLKTRTQKEMAMEVQQYLLNLSTTGDLSLNLSKAMKYLDSCQRKVKKDMPANIPYEIEEEKFEDQSSDLYKKLVGAKELENKIQKQMNEFQIKKEELQNKITNSCELLVKHEFDKEEDVKECKENTEKLLKDYREELKKDKKEVSLINPYLIGTIVVMFFLNVLLFQSTIIGVGCVFFTIAYILFQIIHKPMNFNEDLELEAQISEIYEEFLGNDEITEENYKRFCKELDKYKGLFKQVTDMRLKLEKIKEEIEKLEGYQKKVQNERMQIQKQLWINEGKSSQIQIQQLEKERINDKILLRGQLEEELQAISLSKKMIEALSEQIFTNSVKEINKNVSEIIAKMTDGRYQNVIIDAKFNITVQTAENEVGIESLSKGTIEQIYLAVRIAVIKLLWSDEEMPILLDDSFAFYDDERLEQTLHYLYEYYGAQVIIFTCQKRELEIANKLGFQYRNLTLDT